MTAHHDRAASAAIARSDPGTDASGRPQCWPMLRSPCIAMVHNREAARVADRELAHRGMHDDPTFLPELKTQQARTQALIDERRQAFAARTGQQLGEDNVWLSGRRQEQDALGRVIATLETVAPAEGGGTRAVRGAGVPARTDVIAADDAGSHRDAR